jgi:hypothetical protein
MKKTLYLLLIGITMIAQPGCKPDLEVPPPNIINDDDIFSSIPGIDAYMARIYSQAPIEDFKYNQRSGFKTFFNGATATFTGEAISRDQAGGIEEFNYWADAYILIKDCNYFMETLPKFASNFSETQVKGWLGEARFLRAFTYFALAKRYGGVPIVDHVLTEPGQPIDDVAANIESFKIPRSSEQAVYDFMATDLDFCWTNMPETNKKGRANRYAAVAFKSRVMLAAGCIAKYNIANLTVNGVQVCGIPSAKANEYFKASYDAANLLNGKYSLYKAGWSATDKLAQANNFAQVFLDANSGENIFVRQYKYPDAVHWYDYNNVTRQLWNSGGAAQTNPTLDFVEMFEGLPKNPNGTFQTTDGGGKYILYDNLGGPFVNAEPRLRGTLLMPNDPFKGVNFEFRRGIYTGTSAGGIARLLPVGSTSSYPTTNFLQESTPGSPTTAQITLPNGTIMRAAGASGFYTSINGVAGGISGFSIRKYLDPNKPTAEVANNRSEQAWIEIRYAEVLLNEAEAAFELYTAGQAGTYQADALTNINLVRERAGASLANLATLSLDTVRRERRKELAFENKTWWDLRRWRIIDQEQNGRRWRILNPIYSSDAQKYLFDDRFDERGTVFTFDSKWYYQRIPDAVIAKSPNVAQNPGY